ncbi:hypothetical protein N0V85_009393, partial [Neurospora sp. IMI 360204]
MTQYPYGQQGQYEPYPYNGQSGQGTHSPGLLDSPSTNMPGTATTMAPTGHGYGGTLPTVGTTGQASHAGFAVDQQFQKAHDAQTQGNERYAILDHFLRDPNVAWNPVKVAGPLGGSQNATLSMNSGYSDYPRYRDNHAPSECDTAADRAGVFSDSGYGSIARQSVGNPSVYGDVDRGGDTQIMLQMPQFQLQQDSNPQATVIPKDTLMHDDWSHQNPAARPEGKSWFCEHCSEYVKTKSELKGFSTKNDLQRHLASVHKKYTVVYHCCHGNCPTKTKKEKDWPRADNFRQHLKRVHQIFLKAEDDLKKYEVHLSPEQVLAGPSSAAVFASQMQMMSEQIGTSWTDQAQMQYLSHMAPFTETSLPAPTDSSITLQSRTVSMSENADFPALENGDGYTWPDAGAAEVSSHVLHLVSSRRGSLGALERTRSISIDEPSSNGQQPGFESEVLADGREEMPATAANSDTSPSITTAGMNPGIRPMSTGSGHLRSQDDQRDVNIDQHREITEANVPANTHHDGEPVEDEEMDDAVPDLGQDTSADDSDDTSGQPGITVLKTWLEFRVENESAMSLTLIEDDESVRTILRVLKAKGNLDQLMSEFGYQKKEEKSEPPQPIEKKSEPTSTPVVALKTGSSKNPCSICDKSFNR